MVVNTKIKLKQDFWNSSEWQNKFNIYLWVNIIQATLITYTIYNQEHKVTAIIYGIIMIFILGLPKLSYHKYYKQKQRERRDKIIKDAEEYNNEKAEQTRD